MIQETETGTYLSDLLGGTETKPQSKFKKVYLFHGKGDSPLGVVARLQSILELRHPEITFASPLLPHSDVEVSTEKALNWLEYNFLPFSKPETLIVGVGLGGLLASKLQEIDAGLHVFNLSSPISVDEVRLVGPNSNRISFYSSFDKSVDTKDWPLYAQSFDVSWLMHGVDVAKYTCSFFISCYLQGHDLAQEVRNLIPDREI